MPKMKTKRCAAKRFKKTGSGKITHFRSGHRHNLFKQTRVRKRKLRTKTVISGAMRKRTRIMLPN